MEPRQPGARENVAKNVTVDDCKAKWGKYGLYNNNGLLFCKQICVTLATTPKYDALGYTHECMCSVVHGNWSTSRRHRYIECVGKLLPDCTDTKRQPWTKGQCCSVPYN